MTKISVTFDYQTVLAKLNEIAARLTPAGMRPAMREIGEELSESTKRRFATGIGPDGSPWAPLKPGTVLARLAKLGTAAGSKPLIATGELSRFIRYRVTDGGAGVEIGTNRTFNEGRRVGAEVHQFGTQRIPARPFLGLSGEDKTTVLDILNQFLAP